MIETGCLCVGGYEPAHLLQQISVPAQIACRFTEPLSVAITMRLAAQPAVRGLVPATLKTAHLPGWRTPDNELSRRVENPAIKWVSTSKFLTNSMRAPRQG
jgi:hypothetical protein